MISLNPNETYPINRILQDWQDSTTYYVQAKIYDAETRVLLATKNLTDNGNRWFSSTYKVDHDNVFGNGRRIIIVTTVYTDSGYTSRSTNHVDEPEEYLIQQRWNPSVNFGGGDGGWDHKAIVKEVTLAFNAEMEKLKKDLTPGEVAPPVDMVAALDIAVSKVLAEVSTVSAQVASLGRHPDPTPATDLAPVIVLLRQVMSKIDGLPKFEKTDLTPIIKEMARYLMLLKDALSEEIGAQAAKELTLSFADSPDVIKGQKRKALVQSVASKYVKK